MGFLSRMFGSKEEREKRKEYEQKLIEEKKWAEIRRKNDEERVRKYETQVRDEKERVRQLEPMKFKLIIYLKNHPNTWFNMDSLLNPMGIKTESEEGDLRFILRSFYYAKEGWCGEHISSYYKVENIQSDDVPKLIHKYDAYTSDYHCRYCLDYKKQ